MRTPEQLREAVGAPNLGFVAFDAGVPKRPLTVHEDPQSPRAEAFRQLRTNLQFVDVDEPPRTIVMTSSVPGEGKTTTLVNLAIAVSSAGRRVLVIDADLRRPKVADYLGLDGSVGLTNLLAGPLGLGLAIQPWAGGAFDVIASGPLPPNPSELLGSRQMRELLESVRDDYDLILLDSPPLLPVTDAAARRPVHRWCDPRLPVRPDDASAGPAGRRGAERRLGPATRHGDDDGAEQGAPRVCPVQLLLPDGTARTGHGHPIVGQEAQFTPRWEQLTGGYPVE